MKVLKRAWMPLLIVVVVAIAGFTVYRMHGVFGSDNETTSAGAGLANDAKPFKPQTCDL
jgi:Mycobacterium membrane protein